MNLCVLTRVDTLILFCLCQELYLRFMPEILRYDTLMQPIHQQIVFLFHQAVLVSGSMHLFRFTPAIGNLPAIDWVFQNSADKGGIKQGIFPVLTLNFVNAVLLQIFCHSSCTHICINILIKNGADGNRLFLVNQKHSIF